MAEQYFTKIPTSTLKTYQLNVNLRGRVYSFVTASGVFSKAKLDRGTELLIKSLVLNKKDRLLDLGCGYGVIGIVAAHEVEFAYLSDINQRAVKLTRWNIARANVQNAKVLQSDRFKRWKGKKFNVITLNPPTHAGKDLVQQLIKDSFFHLEPDGRFYFVCKTKLGAKSYAEFIKSVFGNCETIKKGSGYRVFRAENE